VTPTTDGSALDADVIGAIAASNLDGLPTDVVSSLLADAARTTVSAGSTIHREEDAAPHIELLVRGLVRVHLTAADGRTLTIRYCRPGALIGVATVYARGSSRPFAVQALVDSDLLRLRPVVVRRIADRDPRLTSALLTEASERVLGFIVELSDTAFSTVRRRVARHLLDLASEQQQGSELVARISQQDLADAVGTLREVVVPVLRELRQAGVVRTERGRITLLQPEQLLNIE
jgi:CRP/FNR family transcriptional regulator, cyclic AMP receptor protein